MGKGDELIKYITEKMVDYVETPREIRKERSRSREPWRNRWFGMIPISLSLWAERIPRKRKKTD